MNVSLTYLNLNISTNKESITLANIIQLCRNLTHIRFSNGTALRDVVGDFTHTEQQNALIDLELESAFITGRDIRILLQKCQCIRRLIMLGCNTSVLKTINIYASNLEILGYNPSFAVPKLNEKKKNREKINGAELYSYCTDKNSITNEITHHDARNPSGKRKGLRMIYSNDGATCIPILSIFPLIYNNRDTLEIIYATLSDLPQDQIHQLITNYPDFQLTRATHVAFWLFSSIQSLLLQYIRYSTVLRQLHVTNVHNLEALTQILMEIPPLCELSISHVHQNDINSYNNYHTGRADENDIDGTIDVRPERVRITPMTTNNDTENNHLTSLIRLFEKYGEISKMGFFSLESIKLRHWDVTDRILIILADIKTLRTITLEGLLYVTIQFKAY
ncbi:hypothetical protein INT45_013163 [Circinella minor]|uniref:Uncharacterized protein n=1 Tax=Circinella minor TaxID=1195481 RepID=A0A8H7RWQ3_9FUNG|nr:hypothetical protein INT45_013163 [Circinella minor]